MAIDTAEKRLSMMFFNRKVKYGVTSNAAKDKQWRFQMLRLYSGLITRDLHLGSSFHRDRDIYVGHGGI